MKCQKCGTDIPEGKIYCEKCGSAIQMVPDYNPVDDISIDTDTPDAQPDMEAISKTDTEEQPQPRKIHWKRWAVGTLLLVLGGYTTYQIAYRSFGQCRKHQKMKSFFLKSQNSVPVRLLYTFPSAYPVSY